MELVTVLAVLEVTHQIVPLMRMQKAKYARDYYVAYK